MLPYWLLYLYFVVGAVFERETAAAGPRGPLPLAPVPAASPGDVGRRIPVPQGAPRPPVRPMLFLGGVIIALMIGLRFEVGADWPSYEYMFRLARRMSLFAFVQTLGDPGYQALNWAVRRSGGEIWQVNLVGGVVFAWGLLKFAKVQTNPWLTMLVAIPYFVIVVGMGFSRQAMAVGVLLAGLAAVHNGASTLRFAVYVAIAALFHRSAVILFPVVALAGGRSRLINVLLTLSIAYLLYDLFLASSVEIYRERYIEARYAAQGAPIRVILNLVPGLLYLTAWRRFGFSAIETRLWRYFSIAACALAVALVLGPSSAIIDRIGIYVIPLQLAILPRVPVALKLGAYGRLIVILYSTLILLVWLNFSSFARYWVPYSSYL